MFFEKMQEKDLLVGGSDVGDRRLNNEVRWRTSPGAPGHTPGLTRRRGDFSHCQRHYERSQT